MARTKQTARRSTGGLPPRRQLRSSPSGGDGQQQFERQVDIFKERGTRTIIVEGTAESVEKPDLIHLSFLIHEIADTIQEGILKVGRTIAKVRAKAAELSVSNEHVYSDSISSQLKREEVGYYKETSDIFEDDERFKVVETREYYEVKSVVRIYLAGGDNLEKTFSKLCYDLMTKMGLRTYEAPIYEVENITELRNSARQDALENAKEKALLILKALNDDSVSLGPPIAITDIHCNLRDDAEGSFLGNWGGVSTTRTVIGKDQVNKDAAGDEPKAKRARSEEGIGADEPKAKDIDHQGDLDSITTESLFVAPTIRVSACVRTVFEINTSTSGGADEEGQS